MVATEQLARDLQAAVKAAVAASSRPTIPIQFLGRIMTPPADQIWLEVLHVPANRADGYWGSERTYRGALRLILHWPNDDKGAYPPSALLDSISGWFTRGRRMGMVKVQQLPDASSPLDLEAETLYPVTIRYDGFERV